MVRPFGEPVPVGNINGIGVTLRTSSGNMLSCISGVIPHLTFLAFQLWAIFIGLRKAYIEGVTNVILETDNLEIFRAIQYAFLNRYLRYNDLIQQILIRIRDPSWSCLFRFVYPERNRVPTC